MSSDGSGGGSAVRCVGSTGGISKKQNAAATEVTAAFRKVFITAARFAADQLRSWGFSWLHSVCSSFTGSLGGVASSFTGGLGSIASSFTSGLGCVASGFTSSLGCVGCGAFGRLSGVVQRSASAFHRGLHRSSWISSWCRLSCRIGLRCVSGWLAANHQSHGQCQSRDALHVCFPCVWCA